MKKLIVYYGDSPVYVEGFSKDCARSCKGSLHIRPRRPITVTDGEYDHITDANGKYAFMKRWVKVVSVMKEDDERLKPKGAGSAKAAPDKSTDEPEAKTVKKKKKTARKKASKKNKKTSKKKSDRRR